MRDVKLTAVANYKSNTGHWHLVGAVHGHARFKDGELIKTSRVKNFSKEGSLYCFETENNWYFVNSWDLTSFFQRDMLSEVEEL